MELITYAIPFFLLLIIIEMTHSLIKDNKRYLLVDSFSSLGSGILSQFISLFTKSLIFAAYYQLYHFLHRDSVFVNNVKSLEGVISWVAVILIADFIYYWYHRHSHTINILWAFHNVHHSSEYYNLTTALRQTVFGDWARLFYHLIGAVIGIPPYMYFAGYAINLIYQFWIHTEYIDKMGVLEKILVTPSHHRVHHSKQSRYLDCNYGGIFIFWDKLFGTFKEQQGVVSYGVYPPIGTYNPLLVNTRPIVAIFQKLKNKKASFRNTLFQSPLWLYKNGVRNNFPIEKQSLTNWHILFFVGILAYTVFILFIGVQYSSLTLAMHVLLCSLLLGIYREFKN